MITTADAYTVLARAAIFDQRLTKPSDTVAGGWADEFNKHDLEMPDLLAGVSTYYRSGRDRVIQPGDVISHARDLRQRRAQIENAHQARELPPGQPARYESDGGVNASGEPVQAAYDINGAGNLPCTTCDAHPGQVCENPDTGQTTKIPHLARLKAAWIAAGRPKGARL